MDNELQNKRKKSWPLLLGFLLILGSYFGLKGVQTLKMDTAEGKVTDIIWEQIRVRTKGGGSALVSIPYLEIEFTPRSKKGEIAVVNSVVIRPLWFEGYKRDQNISVIFPSAEPGNAQIYSLGEYWFITPELVILGLVCIVWLAIYAVVVFKPWER